MLISLWFAWRIPHVFINRAEDAVDEFSGWFAAEGFGELNGFVDGNFGRDFIGKVELVDAKAQDVAVDDGYLLKGPLGRVFGNSFVDFGKIFFNAFD